MVGFNNIIPLNLGGVLLRGNDGSSYDSVN